MWDRDPARRLYFGMLGILGLTLLWVIFEFGHSPTVGERTWLTFVLFLALASLASLYPRDLL